MASSDKLVDPSGKFAAKQPRRFRGVQKEHVVPLVAFVVVVALFTIVTKGSFLRTSNLALIGNIAFPTMIASLGAVFIYSHGGIDFSLGAVQGLSMLVIALVLNGSMDNLVLALICGVCTSLACGTVLAFIRTTFRLPALIASLCVQSIATGILRAVTSSGSVTIPIGLVKLDSTAIKLTILCIMVVLTVIVFEFTKIGRGNKAIGANPVATSMVGVNNNMMIYFAHLLTNFAVGVSAIFSASQISQVVATSGFGLEMDVLVAAVIGGMSIAGGMRSTILNILVGSVIVALMTNGFSLWGINPNVIMGIKGVIFLIVIFVTRERDKNAIIQ